MKRENYIWGKSLNWIGSNMPYLEQKFLLQQRLSPQQVLFSTLLQLPVMALEQRIKAELELNPLLEEDTELELEQTEPKEEVNEIKEDETEETDSKDEEMDFDELVNDDSLERLPRDESKEEIIWPDPAPVSLSEHLISQLNFYKLSPSEKEIGEYIIWNINEDGYLSCPVETIAENLNVPIEKVLEILKLIQTFDPSGIAARDLKECILIQLKENEKNNEIPIKIIEEYFDDFKNKRYEKIVKLLNISLEEVKSAIKVISKINPKPGEGYIKPNENYVIPDLIVEKIGNDFVVSLSDWNIPRLKISESYRKMLSDRVNVPELTKQYIKQKIESARWLINSIQQRRITIIRVMKEIIKRQRDFFENGKGHIKPMILKDIASSLGMDISTISRVTNGKYVQTDYGVFELKYFFSEKMITSDGEQVSTLNIKDKIKELIENEPPNNLLTDENIVKILSEQKIQIARRTVAKYREQMMIPVARLRRKI
jgi:RNA polymerase sigma-54 factor